MDIPFIPNKELFVIGDVHGCAEELQALLQKLPLSRGCGLVLVGDYIDRGPSSRQVVDTLLDVSANVDVYPLMGNHEALLLDFLDDPTPLHSARFVYNGGGATLQSYCGKPGDYHIPDAHVAFFRSLRLVYQSESHIFVHAGLPDVPLGELDDEEHKETMLWVRTPFHHSTFSWGKTIVHGHSRVPGIQMDTRRINVDTGCVYDNLLSAVHLPSGRVYQVARRGVTDHVYLREPSPSRRRAVRFEGQVDVALSEPRDLPMFRTLNYNDFGLLLVSTRVPDTQVLALHNQVAGTIFPSDDYARVDFRGVVVRVEQAGTEFRYGIQFEQPPIPEP